MRGTGGHLRADEVGGPCLGHADPAGHPALDDDVRARALLAWSALYGTISFELFGHFTGSVVDADSFVDRAMGELAGLLGL